MKHLKPFSKINAKEKSLRFLDFCSKVVFGICIYFLLVLNSLSEILEQTEFKRLSDSLYEKSKKIKSFFVRAKQEQYIFYTKTLKAIKKNIPL
jgi:hypothetical protein